MKILADGGVEMDADELVGMTCCCIDAVLEGAGPIEIGAVACSTFWHSMLGVGRDGSPATPIYDWSDTRSRPDAVTLSRRD